MHGFKLWFVSPVPESAEFRVKGIGVHERMRPRMVDRRLGTADYLFMYFHDPVRIWEQGEIRPFPAESLAIWEPGNRHCYGSETRTWDHSWIHCEGYFVTRKLKALRIPTNGVVPLPDPMVLEKALMGIHEELAVRVHPDPVILQNLFENFLRGLARLIGPDRDPSPVPERFLKVKAWIDAHYAEPLTLGVLAERANLSIPHFCSEFKKYFKVSAIDYLIRLRTHAAAHYLADSNRSVKEVARLVGYEDIFYFSKLFKKRFGMSPRAMRSRLQGGGKKAE
jgi:AraC-like DNA-binding protein